MAATKSGDPTISRRLLVIPLVTLLCNALIQQCLIDDCAYGQTIAQGGESHPGTLSGLLNVL
jgi:hypothetical protein